MKKNWMVYPYFIWMLMFTIVPLFMVLYFSFASTTGGVTHFSLDNFKRVADPLYINVIWRSIRLAFVSTVICLLLGYPVAMILAHSKSSRQFTLIVLFVIPMWMNFLARTYSWMTLLERQGLINLVLGWFGLGPFDLLHTEFAVILGMIYNFLPFMVFPIYTVLNKMDPAFTEAAYDLGATPVRTFIRVTLPLSLPGVLSGISMVFMPAVTTFVIPQLLGGGQFTMIGNLIEQQFLRSNDWGFGSSLSIILMILILLSMRIMSHYDRDGGEGGGFF